MRLILLLPLLIASLACRAQTTNAAAPSSILTGGDPAAAPMPAVDAAKEAEVRKLLDNLDLKGTMRASTTRMMETLKKKYPDLPEDFWTQAMSDANIDDLISRLVPIYGNYYSLEDLKAMNAFYESPVGQHMRKVKAELAASESMAARQWGRELGAKIMAGVFARQAKTYADEDKKHYYTAVSTNAPASAPVASAPVTAPVPSTPAAPAGAAPAGSSPASSPLGSHD